MLGLFRERSVLLATKIEAMIAAALGRRKPVAEPQAFVVSAGDMFWTGRDWSWDCRDGKGFADLASADSVRHMLVGEGPNETLISVRFYLGKEPS